MSLVQFKQIEKDLKTKTQIYMAKNFQNTYRHYYQKAFK